MHWQHLCAVLLSGLDAPLDQALAKDVTVPAATAGKQDTLSPPEGAAATAEGETGTSKLLNNNLAEDKEVEVMDAHEESPAQTEGTGLIFYKFLTLSNIWQQ